MMARNVAQVPKSSGVIFAALAVVCIVIGMTGSWSHWEEKESYDGETTTDTTDFKMNEVTNQGTTVEYDSNLYGIFSAVLSNLNSVFNWLFVFVLISLIASCIGFCMYLVPSFGARFPYSYKSVAKAVVCIAFFFALIALIYIALVFPGAVKDTGMAYGDEYNNPEKSFWGFSSQVNIDTGREITAIWGAGYGWYLTLVAAVCGIFAVAIEWTEIPLLTGSDYENPQKVRSYNAQQQYPPEQVSTFEPDPEVRRIKCPSCGKLSLVEINPDGPTRVKCPNCGKTGRIP